MRSTIAPILLSIALTVVPSVPAPAQDVQYSGKLRIGYGDPDNHVGSFFDDTGVPKCELATDLTANRTLATLVVNGRGTQATRGPGGKLVFHAVGAGQGGAQVREPRTCQSAVPPFANPLLRNRTRISMARWPGNLGGYTPSISMLTSPATPTAMYAVSAGGGIPIGGATRMMGHPLFGSVEGALTFTRGANHFGGGIPYQGGGGLHVGILPPTAIATFGTFTPPDFGVYAYFEGRIPFSPLYIGDAATGGFGIPTTTHPYGLLIGHQDEIYAFRTPGGSTVDQHGAIVTVGGGNTAAPALPDCLTHAIGPCAPITSPIDFRAAFFAWTTGRVRISDRVGSWTTIRSASGFDVEATGPAGTTRRIQLVSPWAAAVAGSAGPFGLPVPELAVSGLAVLTLNVIPLPEYAGPWQAVVGASALALLARMRARSRRAGSLR